MMVLVSMVPFALILVLATFIASIHDFGTGFLINMLGTTTGNSLFYFLTKYLELIKTNVFLAVLFGRLIPILPSVGVNFTGTIF